MFIEKGAYLEQILLGDHCLSAGACAASNLAAAKKTVMSRMYHLRGNIMFWILMELKALPSFFREFTA